MFTRSLALATLLAAMAAASTPVSAQVYGSIGVHIGPPAPIVETVPAPRPGYVWRGGYWSWNGARYVWVHGYYAHPPYGRTVWVPGHWVNTPRGWVFRPGHWR